MTENCDVNVCYKDYPTIIKVAGKNGWALEPNPPQKPETEMVSKAKYDEVVKERDKAINERNAAIKELNSVSEKIQVIRRLVS